jgi:hypothetical protein
VVSLYSYRVERWRDGEGGNLWQTVVILRNKHQESRSLPSGIAMLVGCDSLHPLPLRLIDNVGHLQVGRHPGYIFLVPCGCKTFIVSSATGAGTRPK